MMLKRIARFSKKWVYFPNTQNGAPMDCNFFTVRDWTYLVVSALGIAGGLIAFFWKLGADSKIASYRETIAYIDRHADELKKAWDKVEKQAATIKEIKAFLNRLEQLAGLVNKKAFDGGLVYESFWSYYFYPLQEPKVKAYLEKSRTDDDAIYSHYLRLANDWSPRILKEQASAI